MVYSITLQHSSTNEDADPEFKWLSYRGHLIKDPASLDVEQRSLHSGVMGACMVSLYPLSDEMSKV